MPGRLKTGQRLPLFLRKRCRRTSGSHYRSPRRRILGEPSDPTPLTFS